MEVEQMFNQYMNPSLNPQFQPRRTEIIHVNGENGAMALQMMPNSQALLLDDTAPLVWLAQTDGAGYKTVTPYEITPYKPKTVDVRSLDERITKLERMVGHEPNLTEPHAEQRGADDEHGADGEES